MNSVDRSLLELAWPWMPELISGWVLTFYGLSRLLPYLARQRLRERKGQPGAGPDRLAERLHAAAKLCGPVGGVGALLLVLAAAAMKALRH